MDASSLLRGARNRAELTQRELARRSGVPQPAISRIERRLASPTVDTMERLLKACGLELDAVARPGAGVDVTLIQERLELTPGQRARRAVAEWEGTEPFRRHARRGHG